MDDATAAAEPPLNTREHLHTLLSQIIDHPELRVQISEEIEQTFTQRRAVLVLDMSGFSRTTQVHGVVSFLMMIHQMRLLAVPTIQGKDGTLVKAEADNLYCLFETVDQAVSAAREIIRQLSTVNPLLPAGRKLYASIGVGFGDILVLGDEDLFGDEVNLASKLGEDVAQGGMILLTEGARGELSDSVKSVEERASISGLTLVYHTVA
ncbi:MAG: adenylate/guanylate cyclase domain-containing protein [Alphaproteobacteria bacterium]|nr:adenylate/guanylate cyclase domain-containing protein [Alphaproteobacteria bacterium]MBU1516190.1 adenylate/guanylate cyclase domain-containing protein [Alphaproteobacteria bacterium]MBU2093500.1 adenylate/guanylate cyclase domain-containing protein [Alphaproteobacteria bacterium]MBU2152348.1 adenylate/guanylate cyclase domain-containing protein [Alphaproteobacteria bacterium]MBU2308162.1 adenylate/guanylate cyclase domain-containing protein [Alphaproteobacteria bacterium]